MVRMDKNKQKIGLLRALRARALKIAANRATHGRMENRGLNLFSHRIK
jgi:hypothetical protein